jgi:hypothetical protein
MFSIGKEVTMATAVSEKPWSDYKASDYTIEQWHKACLIHSHTGAPLSKIQCKLPVYTPDGTLNKNGVHAAAAALAGARSALIASAAQKASAKTQLIALYKKLNEQPPPSLLHSAFVDEPAAETKEVEPVEEVDPIDDFLSHFGVKGMKWGVRRNRSGKSGKGGTQTHHKPGDAPDHTRARDLHSAAKTHGTRVLTNKDLEDLNRRLNLEQNYSKLTQGDAGGNAGGKKAMKNGSKWVASVLNNVGKQLATEVLKGHAMAKVRSMGLTANG